MYARGKRATIPKISSFMLLEVRVLRSYLLMLGTKPEDAVQNVDSPPVIILFPSPKSESPCYTET